MLLCKVWGKRMGLVICTLVSSFDACRGILCSELTFPLLRRLHCALLDFLHTTLTSEITFTTARIYAFQTRHQGPVGWPMNRMLERPVPVAFGCLPSVAKQDKDKNE